MDSNQQQDRELQRQLEAIKWPMDYGTVTIQLREGKPTLLKIERTVRLDKNKDM